MCHAGEVTYEHGAGILGGKLKAIHATILGIAWLDGALAAPAGDFKQQYAEAPCATGVAYLVQCFGFFDFKTYAVVVDREARALVVPRQLCTYGRDRETVWILSDYAGASSMTNRVTEKEVQAAQRNLETYVADDGGVPAAVLRAIRHHDRSETECIAQEEWYPGAAGPAQSQPAAVADARPASAAPAEASGPPPRPPFQRGPALTPLPPLSAAQGAAYQPPQGGFQGGSLLENAELRGGRFTVVAGSSYKILNHDVAVARGPDVPDGTFGRGIVLSLCGGGGEHSGLADDLSEAGAVWPTDWRDMIVIAPLAGGKTDGQGKHARPCKALLPNWLETLAAWFSELARARQARCYIQGFSRGAMWAAYLMHKHEAWFDGGAVFGGYLLWEGAHYQHKAALTLICKRIPLVIVHGLRDEFSNPDMHQQYWGPIMLGTVGAEYGLKSPAVLVLAKDWGRRETADAMVGAGDSAAEFATIWAHLLAPQSNISFPRYGEYRHRYLDYTYIDRVFHGCFPHPESVRIGSTRVERFSWVWACIANPFYMG